MSYLWNVHQRESLTFQSGKGVFLITKNSLLQKRRYLDFNAGGAVNSLGYGNKGLIKALKRQAGKIWHLSNYYENRLAEKLATNLCKLAGLKKAFFVNSGSEGVEFALKVARRFFYSKGEGRYEIISLKRGYHGRTMGALSASANPKYREGFEPLCEGFIHVNENLAEIEAQISSKTCAIILEPVQGAEGMHFLGWDFLKEVRKLCDKHGILLILDEIQTGIGRLGSFFAFEKAGIKPDILILAKGIAGGFPLGAVLSSDEIANSLPIGGHGGTFGGNLLGVSVALETISQISKPPFLENVITSSAMLEFCLQEVKHDFPHIVDEVRGFGLMRGLKINNNIDVKNLIATLSRQEELLCGTASGNVLRITPPLIITPEEVKEGMTRLKRLFSKIK
jgi:acetylornithine/N-succinyldiaminopimelate aminotransferase